MQHKVGLSFCQLYTFLPFLPWSVLALSWRILLEGRTNIKFKTSTNTPNRVLSMSGQRKFLQFREIQISAVESYHANMSIKKSESKKNKKELNPDQLFILLIIWTGAVIMGIEAFETQTEERSEVKETSRHLNKTSRNLQRFVILISSSFNYHLFADRILKDDVVDICQVWNDNISLREILIWVVIVMLPLIFGPFLTWFLEYLFSTRKEMDGVFWKHASSRYQRLCIVTVLSIVVTISYSTNLIVTEKYLQPIFNINQFTSLILKYVLGSVDLVISPIIICLLDSDIRQGISDIYKRKRRG